jgi:DNA repair protein RecN (Recombination protein N)
MLRRLYVRNYALIEEQEIRFEKGLTVLTGETGAGKSILLGAFQLVLGQRADPDSLRDKNTKCVVEAEFQLNARFKDLFSKLDFDYADPCIIRREISPNGRSRAFVNDSPVLLDSLRQLSAQLVDIHSQQDQLLIHQSRFQLDLIDLLTEDKNLISDYHKIWKERKKVKEELERLEHPSEGVTGDQDYLQYLLDELEELQITEGEMKQLDERIQSLRHADAILQAAGNSLQQLEQIEGNPIDALGLIQAEMQRLSSKWKEGSVLHDRLSLLTEELENWKRDLEHAIEGVENNPLVLEEAENRLDAYNNLLHKHRLSDEAELIGKREEIREQLQLLENNKERKEELEKLKESLYLELKKKGEQLSLARRNVAKALEKELTLVLKKLELKNASLQLQIDSLIEPSERGLDQLQWMFTANPGSAALPLEKVASGGELSRIMLALKAILAKYRELPTVLFDEIDTGMSGRAAASVADVLVEMGTRIQLLAISHLPQMASAAAQQMRVQKEVKDGQTRTEVIPLNKEERVEEIARMMSSAGVSEAARQQALELLRQYGRV